MKAEVWVLLHPCTQWPVPQPLLQPIGPTWMMPRSSLVVLLAKFILIFICELLAKEHNQLKHHLFVVRVSLGNSLVFACYFFGVWFRFLRGSVGIPRMFLSRKNTLCLFLEYAGCNHLNLGMLVLDLPLPSDGGREAGGADLNPKSLSCEGAAGAACPGGAASVGATGTSPSLAGLPLLLPQHLDWSTNPFSYFLFELGSPNQLDLAKGFHRSTSQVIYSRVL